MDWKEILRRERHVPIRELEEILMAVKIDTNKKTSIREYYTQINLDTHSIFENQGSHSPFILRSQEYYSQYSYPIFLVEYANMKTLLIIAEQSHIQLPSYTIRALMKQILEGMRSFHSVGLVHRDIKCDNILLHSPPGSGRVHVKISDFGFAKKVDLNNEQTYLAGIFRELKNIERPKEITDNQMWDLLSKLLEFDPDKRISAAEALQHQYFTSPEALADISPLQKEIAQLTATEKEKGKTNISEYDINPSFIVAESNKLNKDYISSREYHYLTEILSLPT
ncbi:MAG: hypothetical protein EZS28_006184 [Streblomastix strix]|uniref:Protein kinase domain-containing protein n=1 Tax=Streblomastix strix TaxID=222440 RepID=A0A5J4WTJ1_9EUKA|nr:MAG: hypothetical protein EZS28_006184 [Streblomastix strix]